MDIFESLLKIKSDANETAQQIRIKKCIKNNF